METIEKRLRTSHCEGGEQPSYPIITRDTTPHWENIFGEMTWVQEVYTEDWGPKQGVRRAYIVAPENDDPVRNARNLNRLLGSMGYRLRGHGSTLPEGMERRPGPGERKGTRGRSNE